MAKKINFKGTSETVKNAVKNFYDGYVMLANAQATYRQEKKTLDAKYATDEKAAKDKMASAKSDSAKQMFTTEYNNLIAQHDTDTKDLLDKRKSAEKEAKKLYSPAYDLVIPFDENDKLYAKKSEEAKALHSAYVYYQKTNDFDRFSKLFSQFLINIGYDKIANDPKYCETTALVFKTRLASLPPFLRFYACLPLSPRRFPRFDSWAGDFHIRFFIRACVFFIFYSRVVHNTIIA